MKNSGTGNVKVAEKNKNHGDPWIWGIYFMLCFISVLEAYSASSQMIGSSGVFGPLIKHAGTLLAGGVVLFVVQHFSYEKIIPWIPVAIVLTIVSMIYVLFKGIVVNIIIIYYIAFFHINSPPHSKSLYSSFNRCAYSSLVSSV